MEDENIFDDIDLDDFDVTEEKLQNRNDYTQDIDNLKYDTKNKASENIKLTNTMKQKENDFMTDDLDNEQVDDFDGASIKKNSKSNSKLSTQRQNSNINISNQKNSKQGSFKSKKDQTNDDDDYIDDIDNLNNEKKNQQKKKSAKGWDKNNAIQEEEIDDFGNIITDKKGNISNDNTYSQYNTKGDSRKNNNAESYLRKSKAEALEKNDLVQQDWDSRQDANDTLENSLDKKEIIHFENDQREKDWNMKDDYKEVKKSNKEDLKLPDTKRSNKDSEALRLDSNWDKPKPNVGTSRNNLDKDQDLDDEWQNNSDDKNLTKKQASQKNNLADNTKDPKPKAPFGNINVKNHGYDNNLDNSNLSNSKDLEKGGPFGKIKAGNHILEKKKASNLSPQRNDPFSQNIESIKKSSRNIENDISGYNDNSRVNGGDSFKGSDLGSQPSSNNEEEIDDFAFQEESMPEDYNKFTSRSKSFQEELLDDLTGQNSPRDNSNYSKNYEDDFESKPISNHDKKSLEDQFQYDNNRPVSNIEVKKNKNNIDKSKDPSKSPNTRKGRNKSRQDSSRNKRSNRKPDNKRHERNKPPSRAKISVDNRSNSTGYDQKKQKTNINFGAYYKERNHITQSNPYNKSQQTNKSKYKKNASEGGLEKIQGEMNALERVQFFLNNYWDEPQDLLQMYKRNAIMHNYIKDLNSQQNKIINKEKIKLISGRMHFNPLKKDDKRNLAKEIANQNKVIGLVEKEEEELDIEVNRTSNPLLLNELNDTINKLKERNKEYVKTNKHVQLEVDQNDRIMENVCDQTKIDEQFYREQKKMQDLARELAHNREKKEKILEDLDKLKEKKIYFESQEEKYREEVDRIKGEAYSSGINLSKKFKDRVDVCFKQLEKAERTFHLQKINFKTQADMYEHDIEQSKLTHLKMINLLQNAEEQIEKQEEIVNYLGQNDVDCQRKIEEWARKSNIRIFDRDYQNDTKEDSKDSISRSRKGSQKTYSVNRTARDENSPNPDYKTEHVRNQSSYQNKPSNRQSKDKSLNVSNRQSSTQIHKSQLKSDKSSLANPDINRSQYRSTSRDKIQNSNIVQSKKDSPMQSKLRESLKPSTSNQDLKNSLGNSKLSKDFKGSAQSMKERVDLAQKNDQNNSKVSGQGKPFSINSKPNMGLNMKPNMGLSKPDRINISSNNPNEKKYFEKSDSQNNIPFKDTLKQSTSNKNTNQQGDMNQDFLMDDGKGRSTNQNQSKKDQTLENMNNSQISKNTTSNKNQDIIDVFSKQNSSYRSNNRNSLSKSKKDNVDDLFGLDSKKLSRNRSGVDDFGGIQNDNKPRGKFSKKPTQKMTYSKNEDEDWGDEDSPLRKQNNNYDDDDIQDIGDSGVRNLSKSQSRNKNVGISLVKKKNMASNQGNNRGDSRSVSKNAGPIKMGGDFATEKKMGGNMLNKKPAQDSAFDDDIDDLEEKKDTVNLNKQAQDQPGTKQDGIGQDENWFQEKNSKNTNKLSYISRSLQSSLEERYIYKQIKAFLEV